jgi:hypothetical protein
MLLAYSSLGLTSTQYRILLVLVFFTSLQILLMRPSVLLVLETMLSMCFDQDKLLDMSTPRSLMVDTCSSMFSVVKDIYTSVFWWGCGNFSTLL